MKLKRGKPKAPRVRSAPSLGFHWMIMAAIATVCAIGFFVAVSFPDWRITDTTTIHWYTESSIGVPSKLNNQVFNPVKFGLYVTSFGGITSEAWFRKTTRICSGIDSYAPAGSVLDLLTGSPCPASCVQHYRTRCNVYSKLTNICYTLLGSYIIVGMLALVGAGWLLVFGKNNILLQILWLGGGLVNLVIFGWWVMEADQGFYQLGLESQYPYPSLGPAAIVGLSFTVVLCFLGIMVSVVSCVEDSQYWTKKQVQIDEAILGAAGPLNQAGGGLPNTSFTPFANPGNMPQLNVAPAQGRLGQSMGLQPGFGPPTPMGPPPSTGRGGHPQIPRPGMIHGFPPISGNRR